jgi:hypothetical protein
MRNHRPHSIVVLAAGRADPWPFDREPLHDPARVVGSLCRRCLRTCNAADRRVIERIGCSYSGIRRGSYSRPTTPRACSDRFGAGRGRLVMELVRHLGEPIPKGAALAPPMAHAGRAGGSRGTGSSDSESGQTLSASHDTGIYLVSVSGRKSPDASSDLSAPRMALQYRGLPRRAGNRSGIRWKSGPDGLAHHAAILPRRPEHDCHSIVLPRCCGGCVSRLPFRPLQLFRNLRGSAAW